MILKRLPCSLVQALGVAGVLAGAATAHAHIHLDYPLSRTTSDLGDQKDQHCGVTGSVRNPARVTELAPGATITVTWRETVQHPGHFRIAFNPDGQTFSIPPDATSTTQGVDPMVLLDLIEDNTTSATVTLPNIECDNCTLQFIQLMTDKLPYTTDANSDDIYFNCADLRLTNTPGGSDAGPGGGDGGTGGDAGNGSPAESGCQATSGLSPSTIAMGFLLLALAWRRRQNPRRG